MSLSRDAVSLIWSSQAYSSNPYQLCDIFDSQSIRGEIVRKKVSLFKGEELWTETPLKPNTTKIVLFVVILLLLFFFIWHCGFFTFIRKPMVSNQTGNLGWKTGRGGFATQLPRNEILSVLLLVCKICDLIWTPSYEPQFNMFSLQLTKQNKCIS